MGALLPDVLLSAVHLDADGVPPIYAEPSMWEEKLGVPVGQRPSFVVLSDPYSFDTEAFVKGLDRAYPMSVKAGGLASAATQPGMNALFLKDRVYSSGAIALALTGNVDMRAVVTQGSRPIGEPMFVTQVHENLIRELDGFVPRDVLDSLFERLSAEDRELVSDSLFLGIAVAGGRSEYGPGDFLVSDILGMDPETGALWVNAQVPANHVVQFHLRDAHTADSDLERSLQTLRGSLGASPAGAMLFSCTGRGSSFYGQPDHDSNAFRRLIGEVPIGGCFCSGEIGPLKQSSYLHGYTSSFAVFTERSG
jgi:small ligand-binding sensory domain FIST